MLLIPCPWCGDHEEAEFSYGGRAVPHPEDPEALDDAAWAEYLFSCENPEGEWLERWFHVAGCRRWFVAARDTRSNRFLVTQGVARPGEVVRAAG